MNSTSSYFWQYLHETLGLQYVPETSVPATAQTAAAMSQVIWQKPSLDPVITFLNTDSDTKIQDGITQDLLNKIVQAIGYRVDQIWYVDSHGRSFMDFLNWMRSQELYSPLVVMKKDPDIQNHVQNAGPFDWVECFSLQAMLEKNSLKKPTWEMLKLLNANTVQKEKK
jgi:hypothetical protein